jgi:beta-aspartyl-peptidase (threonine type)
MTQVARLFLSLLILLGTLPATDSYALKKAAKTPRAMLVIHGGAGTISRDQMTPEKEKAYHAGLSDALAAGYTILNRGGTAMDAVEATICVLEDDSLFNAGRGSVYASDGHIEMDASIMDGKTHHGGAVASVSGIRNPIKAARAVMDKTSHVMLVGAGAEEFARAQGLQFEDSTYFATRRRWDELEKVKSEEKSRGQYGSLRFPHTEMGTVGAVAVDHNGDLAAATSTGGLTNKHWGRVGDSPIIGAGTYADNETCAVSCTGTGEFFILGSYAHEVSSLMQYRGMSVLDASRNVIQDQLVKLGGKDTGGLIAMDRKGNFAMEMNTTGMYRGYIGEDGVPHTFIYHDE